MKSRMTFIQGNRYIEREKDNFKSPEVKRWKECALALEMTLMIFFYGGIEVKPICKLYNIKHISSSMKLEVDVTSNKSKQN